LRTLEYLEWALDRHPRARLNLAVSGVPDAPPELLGEPPAPADRAVHGRLRAAVARHLGVPEEEVAPSIGTSQAIWQACVATLSAGDVVAVEDPAYEPLVAVPAGIGAKVVRFARRPADAFAPDVDGIDAALAAGAKLVVLTDLHNPSGVTLDPARLRAIADRAAARGAFVLVDEVYRAIDPSRTPATSRLAHPNVIAIASLTKVFGLGWARVGWLVGPGDVAARARAANLHVAGLMPVPGAAWGERALRRLDVLRARTDALLEGKRPIFDAWMAARPELSWTPPGRSLFGLVRVEGLRGSRAFCDGLHDRTGLLVTPGSFFDLDDHLRVSWGEPPDKLREGLAILAEALDDVRR
jgi:hypothetical protein